MGGWWATSTPRMRLIARPGGSGGGPGRDRRRRGPVVCVETADDTASACPSCGAFSLSVKRRVSSRPLNIPYGATVLRLVRHKRRWRYVHRGCARGSFTETVTAVPARALHADAYADKGA
jgi:hypothetical protein